MNNSNYNDRNNNYINALQRVRNISNPTNISVSANTNSNTNTQSTANEGDFLLRTVGTIGGGIVGLAAAATTGDFSKAFQYKVNRLD